MRRTIPPLLVCLLAAGLAAAEDGPSPRGHAATRAAWRWLETTREVQREMRAPLQKLRDAGMHTSDPDAYRAFALEMYRLGRELVTPAQEAFRDAFAASDWSAWDAEADESLLAQGLDLVARHQLEREPRAAVATLEHLVEVLPEHALAQRAVKTWLPIALPATGDLALARARLTAMVETAGADAAPHLLMTIGDVHAMEGDYAAAQARYEAARAHVRALPEAEQSTHKRTLGYLEMRANLIGRPAPPLGETTFVGGAPCTLASLREKGRVVLVDFWATWCGPCLQGIPGIQALHETRAAKGLTVLGVTRVYEKRGVLPAKDADERGPALPKELYKGTTREAYLAHLEAFRQRVPVTYPFVVADGDVIKKQYRVTGIPTMVVIDPDGRVGFLAVGGMRERLLQIAVDRRLQAERSD